MCRSTFVSMSVSKLKSKVAPDILAITHAASRAKLCMLRKLLYGAN